jgi:hypothetical protein
LVGQSIDIATTVAFTTVVAGQTVVSAANFNELLHGVNAIRSLSGWTPLAWSNVLSPADSLPDQGTVAFGRHLLAIRARLNEAMQAIGAPAVSYTDPDPDGLVIRAVHINEIQNVMK